MINEEKLTFKTTKMKPKMKPTNNQVKIGYFCGRLSFGDFHGNSTRCQLWKTAQTPTDKTPRSKESLHG
jgi:hypothetical protein